MRFEQVCGQNFHRRLTPRHHLRRLLARTYHPRLSYLSDVNALLPLKFLGCVEAPVSGSGALLISCACVAAAAPCP